MNPSLGPTDLTVYRSYADRGPSACQNPGATHESIANKFADGAPHEGFERVYNAGTTFESVFQSTGRNLQPHHYKEPDRRGVMAEREEKAKVAAPVKFIGQSSSSTDFRDWRADAKAFKNTSGERLRAAFDGVAGDRGLLYVKDLRRMLSDALGGGAGCAPENIVRQVANLLPDNPVGWAQLAPALAHAQGRAQDELRGFGRIVNPLSKEGHQRVVKSEPIWSAHHLDFGVAGSDPKARSGPSTADLHVGTTKWSRQIPGYMGFLPSAKTNPTAVRHGYASDVRPPNSDNRDNVNQNMPGYTGHSAKAAINDHGPKRVNVVTTQGHDQEAVFRAASLMQKYDKK